MSTYSKFITKWNKNCAHCGALLRKGSTVYGTKDNERWTIVCQDCYRQYGMGGGTFPRSTSIKADIAISESLTNAINNLSNHISEKPSTSSPSADPKRSEPKPTALEVIRANAGRGF